MRQLTWNGIPVATTAMLAESCGVDVKTLKQNYNNNKDRYEESKHFFLIKGADLKAFKDLVENFDQVNIDRRSPILYLWTEKGAFNHVKSLGTDEAWDAYENLVDTYFAVKEITQSSQQNTSLILEFTQRPRQIQNSKEVNTHNFNHGGKEQIIEYNRKNCLLHTGLTPHEIVEHAKKNGMPAKMRTSAKEVLRNANPSIASSMALADDFCKTGKVTIDEAANFCRQNALPVFIKMAELGLLPSPAKQISK